MRSMYLRGETTSSLVKIHDMGDSKANAELARDVATELGIYPKGSAVLVYSVVDQDEWFYNKLITQDEAERIIQDDECSIQ
jgi:hypothetical protein